MKILTVADLHYSLQQYDWLVDIAPHFDLVVIAGDHLDMSSMVDGLTQSVVIRKYLQRLREKTRVLVSSGNHDLDVRNEDGEKVSHWIQSARTIDVPTDGDSFLFEGTLFTICPWWDGPQTREALASHIASDARKQIRPWVWVHHAPPTDSPTSWGGKRFFGDLELVSWIAEYRPDMVLAGHVHQSPFVKDGCWVDRVGETWVFNAGHQYGAPPAHIVIDTDERTATWISAAGIETVDLGQPPGPPVRVPGGIPAFLTSADPAPGPIPA
ncbi:MAG TPA: metallophosphoesterase [Bauldia sp.]|nr:metallophosphoesterase [Bauldia sp.]